MSPNQQSERSYINSDHLNNYLSLSEVEKAVKSLKNKKAYILIPNDAMKSQNAIRLLHKLFNLCFSSGLSPTDWDYSHIKPIPKKGKDFRIPLNSRCITLMSCVAKLYSKILTSRLSKYVEENNLLVDEQNGFRSSRSCIDHIFVLSTILRNRLALGKDTFCCFIDYLKAFDSVNRIQILFRLSEIGIHGNFYNAISSMYSDPRAKIILNEFETDFFGCPVGLKQGACESPILFAIFVNSLAEEIKKSNIGVRLSEEEQGHLHPPDEDEEEEIVSILLYCDDIVLTTENEEDLQFLLLIVENWCRKWQQA